MSHTPGPWNYRKPFIIAPPLEADGPLVEIAELLDYDTSSVYAKYTDIDGRLIAAAPDLLEACQRMLLWRYAMHNAELPPHMERDWNFAAQAVAKAEGQ